MGQPARAQHQPRVAGQLQQHQGADRIRKKVDPGLHLDGEPVVAAHDGSEQPERALEAAGGPAPLLPAICVDRHRQLLGHDQVLEVGSLPPAQLGAVAEVEVFGERGRAPAARVLDRGASPHAGRAGEVREVAARRAHCLLDQEVEVDGQRLQPREPRVALVEVAPASLHETDRFVGEDAHRPAQEIGRRHEVGVEDGNERRLRERHAVRERAGLEAGPLLPAHLRHLEAAPPPARDSRVDDGSRLVVGVVQHLHLEAVGRPLDRADRVDHALGDVPLVVDRDLHAHQRLSALRRGIGSRGTQAGRAPGEVQQVHPERQQQHAGRRQHDEQDGRDGGHESNSVYGRIVSRTNATRASASGRCLRVHCMYRHAALPKIRAAPSSIAG